MKRNSLTIFVVLTLALLVSAYSGTTQSRAVDFGSPQPVLAATDANPESNAAAFQANQKIKFPPISISLTFGRASKKCAGWGICKITVGKLSAARTVQAELSRTE